MKLLVLLALAVSAVAAPNQACGLRVQPARITHDALEEKWLEHDLIRDGWVITIGQEDPWDLTARAKRPGPDGPGHFMSCRPLGMPKIRLLLLRRLHQQIRHPRPEPEVDYGEELEC